MANHLFLIGIDNYLYHDVLNNCVKDVTDFRDILIEKFDFEEGEVTELFNGKATNRSIQDSLSNYVRTLTLHDNLVIYFSGHGHYDKHLEKGYWIPADGTHSYPTWVSNETIMTLLGKIECKHIFLITDSCFSNSVFIQNPTKGLKDYSKYKSRWALTSAFELAYDSSKGQNGPFAKAILEFMVGSESEFRVGELIEHVKRVFSANEFQTPQGSAIYCKGHSGGEMIFQIKQHLDSRALKGYNDFQKALQSYKRKSNFIQIVSFEDKNTKIGYQICKEVDPVIKKMTYYLYLYEGAVINKTYKHITENHPEIFREKNMIIFLPKENDQSNPQELLANVNAKFKPINAFYINDFIRDQCTPHFELDKSNFLSISNFILPSFSNGLPEDEVQDYIYKWFRKEGEPILAIKGTGGIGKTTFAQFIADLWTQKTPNAHVIYIDSIYIKDFLMRQRHQGSPRLYDFYEAFCEITGARSNKLTEELFRLNMDAGNILVVIDGLDEVISKIPHFKVDAFLSSITEVSNELASGKVVITCRTHFWDTSDLSEINLSVIGLEPFNLNQTKLFFEKSLDSNTKVKKALKLAEQFKYPGTDNGNQFHPYVLDVVRSIVASGKDSMDIDLSEFSSQVLSSTVKNDYIIYRICDRERLRVGQMHVDDQVRFFIFLATEKRGIFRSENFKELLEGALKKKIESAHAITFKSHPFLNVNETTVSFKYDFLSDLFKSIYISGYLDFENEKRSASNSMLFGLIEENCWFGSPINSDIMNRVRHWNDYDVLTVADLIKNVSASDLGQERKSKTIGNIFSLCLSINQKYKTNDIESNTLLLKSLFEGNDGIIRNLAIIKIDFENHIRFDFSGLKFSRSYFSEYSSFWDCKFDEETKFTECWLLNLKARTDKQSISNESFIDCIYDQDLEEALRKFHDKGQSKVQQAKDFLNDFFHLFFSSGKLGRQWEHKIIQPRFSGISRNRFDYNNTIKILKTHKFLVVTKETSHNKFAIADEFKEDVVRFSKDGTMSNHISSLIVELSRS